MYPHKKKFADTKISGYVWTGPYYDMRKGVCYIETKKVVKNVANTIVITYAVLTKSYHKCPCKLTAL